jgi:hypothetical protein
MRNATRYQSEATIQRTGHIPGTGTIRCVDDVTRLSLPLALVLISLSTVFLSAQLVH